MSWVGFKICYGKSEVASRFFQDMKLGNWGIPTFIIFSTELMIWGGLKMNGSEFRCRTYTLGRFLPWRMPQPDEWDTKCAVEHPPLGSVDLRRRQWQLHSLDIAYSNFENTFDMYFNMCWRYIWKMKSCGKGGPAGLLLLLALNPCNWASRLGIFLVRGFCQNILLSLLQSPWVKVSSFNQPG